MRPSLAASAKSTGHDARSPMSPSAAWKPPSIGLFRGQSWIRRRFLRAYHHEVIETRPPRRPGTRAKLFDAFLEGYGLIQKRLRRAMASEQVVHIPCEGKPVDPELMTVIELVDEPR